MKGFNLPTEGRSGFYDITSRVEQAVTESGVREGICLVWCPHTTAGLTVNENADPDVPRDIIDTLEKLVPWRAGYRHSEGNAAAHVKASLMGSSVVLPVSGGKLALGTWQAVFFCEFDGPRQRSFFVQILPSTK
jgi:secondary thiamine-phosphate synthase enzyme